VSNEQASNALNELSSVLWRERQVLELLVFKLETEQLVLTSGRPRWLNHASREVELVLEQLQMVELVRAVKFQVVATELGLDPAAGLRSMTETVEDPWPLILGKHRRALVDLTEEVRLVSDLNRDLLAKGRQATRDALAWLADGATVSAGYDAGGSADRWNGKYHLLNQAF
jgi:hypothetical protein